MVLKRALLLTDLALNALIETPFSRSEHLLLWSLAASLPRGGDTLTLSTLATQLSLSSVHVSNSMGKLIRAGYLIRGAKTGTSYHYKLNPAFFQTL